MVLLYGLPSACRDSVIGLANVICKAISTLRQAGHVADAARVFKLEELLLSCRSRVLLMALTTYTGQNLGAMQYDRAGSARASAFWSPSRWRELIGVGVSSRRELISIFTRRLRRSSPRAASANHCAVLLPAGLFPAVALRSAAVRAELVPMTIMLATWCALRIVYISTIMTSYTKFSTSIGPIRLHGRSVR